MQAGAKLVTNRGIKEGEMSWQRGGKGCAMACPGNVSVPEMDDPAGAGCSFMQPRDWMHSQVSLLPGQAPAGRHLAQETQGCSPPGCKGEAHFFLGRVEMPLLVNARE